MSETTKTDSEKGLPEEEMPAVPGPTLNHPVLIGAVGVIVAVTVFCLISPERAEVAFAETVAWATQWFGWYYIALGTVVLVFVLFLAVSRYGKIRLLIPMLAHVHEIEQALGAVAQARASLDEQGIPYDRDMAVGGMVEIPAAALSLGVFVRKLDFLSIGTNDLIQYTLAIDRTDDAVAHLYDPMHPAVLQLIGMTIRTGERAGKPARLVMSEGCNCLRRQLYQRIRQFMRALGVDVVAGRAGGGHQRASPHKGDRSNDENSFSDVPQHSASAPPYRLGVFERIVANKLKSDQSGVVARFIAAAALKIPQGELGARLAYGQSKRRLILR